MSIATTANPWTLRTPSKREKNNGLSKLQRVILRIALRNYHRPPDVLAAHVTRAEILAEHYGWTPARGLRDNVGRTFSKRTIGGRAYSSAQVAVCKAVGRLTKRGLIGEAYGGPFGDDFVGYRLTDAGLAAADALEQRESSGSGDAPQDTL